MNKWQHSSERQKCFVWSTSLYKQFPNTANVYDYKNTVSRKTYSARNPWLSSHSRRINFLHFSVNIIHKNKTTLWSQRYNFLSRLLKCITFFSTGRILVMLSHNVMFHVSYSEHSNVMSNFCSGGSLKPEQKHNMKQLTLW
jgi:hypothetical protein